jgi:hypothetical protein
MKEEDHTFQDCPGKEIFFYKYMGEVEERNGSGNGILVDK